jgi:hypothetical protein
MRHWGNRLWRVKSSSWVHSLLNLPSIETYQGTGINEKLSIPGLAHRNALRDRYAREAGRGSLYRHGSGPPACVWFPARAAPHAPKAKTIRTLTWVQARVDPAYLERRAGSACTSDAPLVPRLQSGNPLCQWRMTHEQFGESALLTIDAKGGHLIR